MSFLPFHYKIKIEKVIVNKLILLCEKKKLYIGTQESR